MRLDDDIQLAILGPLEVHSHGHEVPIRGSRKRMVLASLLLAAGGLVSLDRLVETVWDSEPVVLPKLGHGV
jgi:DNA-binding SARP family transcriptional activator